VASLVVVDSGVVLATILEESYSEKAKALTKSWDQQDLQLCAPMLFRYEVVAVMRKSVVRNRLTPDEAREGRERLLAYPIIYYLDDALLRRAYELATQFNRPTAYDSQYLAVAERLGCDFWTADERLYNALNIHLAWVKWVGDLRV